MPFWGGCSKKPIESRLNLVLGGYEGGSGEGFGHWVLIPPGREGEEQQPCKRRGEEDEKDSQAEVKLSGGPSIRRGWREGEGVWRPPSASRNPARSCLAFVGLSWTLNVFLINRPIVSKPPRGVYKPAIKWERSISCLLEAFAGNFDGRQNAAPLPNHETTLLASLLLRTTFYKWGSSPGKQRVRWQPPLSKLLFPRLTHGALESLNDSQAGKKQPQKAARLHRLFIVNFFLI